MSKNKKNKEESFGVMDEIMNLISPHFEDDQEQGNKPNVDLRMPDEEIDQEQGDKTIFADLLPDEETRKKQEKDK